MSQVYYCFGGFCCRYGFACWLGIVKGALSCSDSGDEKTVATIAVTRCRTVPQSAAMSGLYLD
jgi:hypothetical protein